MISKTWETKELSPTMLRFCMEKVPGAVPTARGGTQVDSGS